MRHSHVNFIFWNQQLDTQNDLVWANQFYQNPKLHPSTLNSKLSSNQKSYLHKPLEMSTRRINIVALLFIQGNVECCNSAKSNEAKTKGKIVFHILWFTIWIQGLLITGGDGEASRSVEIFSLNNRDLQCELEPDLPDIRTDHTQNGFIICGGYNSCLTLAGDGQWNVSHQLKYKRYQHSSWDTPDGGVLLIGGVYSRTTTELLTDDGGSVEKFKLKQRSE